MQITKILSILIISSLILASCSNDDDNSTESGNTPNTQQLGTSANDLLSDATYKGLTIELVSVEGHEPTINAVNIFKRFLEERVFKPDGITVKQRSVPSSGKSPFSIREIAQIEQNTRTEFNQGDEIAVFVYFADGSSEEDNGQQITLGSAYRNTSMVIYEGTLRRLSSNPRAPMLSTIEAATLNHEFAHLMGLVNIGTPLQSPHEDSENKGHCNVPNCLMEAAISLESGMMDMLGDGVPVLDPLCIADLRANGGR